ncbi:MAG: hypothetical protein JNK73_13790 [Bacteroidia bacterium]|nr:hypothetical protein [Bacteroidia bacterium]
MFRLLFFVLTFILFTGSSLHQLNNQTKPKSSACGETPELNKKILTYVKANMGKRLGNGECWDVVAGALNYVGAKWDKKFNFGKLVDYKKDCVFPGDIIQLNDAMMHDEPVKGVHVYDEYPQHSAIILEVKNTQEYILADQNFGLGKNKLNTHPINLKKLTKGTVKVYRPVK